MGIIRTAFRKLLDSELGVLGGEIERLLAKNEDQRIQLEAFAARYERLQNRVGMRLSRARTEDDVRPAADDWDAMVADDVARRRGGGWPM